MVAGADVVLAPLVKVELGQGQAHSDSAMVARYAELASAGPFPTPRWLPLPRTRGDCSETDDRVRHVRLLQPLSLLGGQLQLERGQRRR